MAIRMPGTKNWEEESIPGRVEQSKKIKNKLKQPQKSKEEIYINGQLKYEKRRK